MAQSVSQIRKDRVAGLRTKRERRLEKVVYILLQNMQLSLNCAIIGSSSFRRSSKLFFAMRMKMMIPPATRICIPISIARFPFLYSSFEGMDRLILACMRLHLARSFVPHSLYTTQYTRCLVYLSLLWNK